HLLHGPDVVSQAGDHGRGAFLPLAAADGSETEAVMGPAQVVGRADQPHAAGQQGRAVGQAAPAPGQGRQRGAERGIEPFDIGGVDLDAAPRLRAMARVTACSVPKTTRRVTSTRRRPWWLLTTCASSTVWGSTRRGRPRRPVRTATRNTVRAAPT